MKAPPNKHKTFLQLFTTLYFGWKNRRFRRCQFNMHS